MASTRKKIYLFLFVSLWQFQQVLLSLETDEIPNAVDNEAADLSYAEDRENYLNGTEGLMELNGSVDADSAIDKSSFPTDPEAISVDLNRTLDLNGTVVGVRSIMHTFGDTSYSNSSFSNWTEPSIVPIAVASPFPLGSNATPFVPYSNSISFLPNASNFDASYFAYSAIPVQNYSYTKIVPYSMTISKPSYTNLSNSGMGVVYSSPDFPSNFAPYSSFNQLSSGVVYSGPTLHKHKYSNVVKNEESTKGLTSQIQPPSSITNFKKAVVRVPTSPTTVSPIRGTTKRKPRFRSVGGTSKKPQIRSTKGTFRSPGSTRKPKSQFRNVKQSRTQRTTKAVFRKVRRTTKTQIRNPFMPDLSELQDLIKILDSL
ncbi:uncharacterized protein LOC134228011 [Armigeres subalbatus]|uniref:uncharacterized protein LOC134228011 n=1 Tax=Armigeres subalbatus TaxID=124917 RepID=UPI002ECFFA63